MSCLIVPMWLFFLRFVLFILDKRAFNCGKTSINLVGKKIYWLSIHSFRHTLFLRAAQHSLRKQKGPLGEGLGFN